MIIKLCLLLSVSSILLGCTSVEKKPIETHQNLLSRVNQNGTTEYIFTLNWFLPQIQPSRRSNGYQGSSRLEAYDRRSSLLIGSANISNEMKLEMEDLAVAKLKNTLKQKELCPKGHSIDEILWQEKSIKLRGQCI